MDEDHFTGPGTDLVRMVGGIAVRFRTTRRDISSIKLEIFYREDIRSWVNWVKELLVKLSSVKIFTKAGL